MEISSVRLVGIKLDNSNSIFKSFHIVSHFHRMSIHMVLGLYLIYPGSRYLSLCWFVSALYVKYIYLYLGSTPGIHRAGTMGI